MDSKIFIEKQKSLKGFYEKMRSNLDYEFEKQNEKLIDKYVEANAKCKIGDTIRGFDKEVIVVSTIRVNVSMPEEKVTIVYFGRKLNSKAKDKNGYLTLDPITIIDTAK